MELSTSFDAKLSHIITPTLMNYELVQISNLSYGNEEFQQSVKNYIPEGFTFKGFPLHTAFMDSQKIFDLIVSNEVISLYNF